MWFKNLRIYSFTQPFTWTEASVATLEERRFSPCARSEPSSVGWIPPLGAEDGPLTHEIGSFVLLCLKKEEKVMPSSTVKAELETRKEAYEQEHARPMPRKEQQTLKEDILHQMLPQAFSKYAVTWAILDTQSQLIYVDASSASKAEELTAVLRSCLGSLPVKPWGGDHPGHHVYTDWVKQQAAPNGFELGLDAELRGERDDDSVVRFKNHDLTTEEVALHLSHGKQVTQLGMNWQDRVQFTLTDDYALKRIQFGDIVKEQREDNNAESRAEQLDLDFSLMAGEFAELIQALQQTLDIQPQVES
ncbi:recombination-associated protein RdgC [Aliidiomarina indica]|uniref:recombination-associated protein RdgC n=1 Tax=Aliidiomarina indica TaxID=2749147 RepID=UPI0018908E4A|nr:recombination-associated protein RdgC [Aliidiomarina indica]